MACQSPSALGKALADATQEAEGTVPKKLDSTFLRLKQKKNSEFHQYVGKRAL